MKDSYGTYSVLTIGKQDYAFCDLKRLARTEQVAHLPYTLKIVLENLLRNEDGLNVTRADIDALLSWNPQAEPQSEIAFTPARVILQDFTGVPAVVDLAAMRDALKALGHNPEHINPLTPVELVVDHSVMVDYFNSAKALNQNTAMEYERNRQRYAFLRWGQQAFNNFRVVPPGQGIVHQVNLEYLARVVFAQDNAKGQSWLYPDTVVGTDSHTTMINGLGILGWGVGGIEAEAAMLGQPITMLVPQVVGFELSGKLIEGTTATDLVLFVTEKLRKVGVVGKFVEFFGEGLDDLSLADRATIANMAPEYGATCGYFPIDEETLSYLRLTGRSDEVIERVRAYAKAIGIFREPNAPAARYSSVVGCDLSEIVPCLAGPKRPQDRVPLSQMKTAFPKVATEKPIDTTYTLTLDGNAVTVPEGAVVIAAITSCTNTSNPAVMLAAGLLAKKARDLGLKQKPWVKTSLAPGSQVVRDYLIKAGLMPAMEALGFYLVGYGCTTCIGNSGPLPDTIARWIDDEQPMVAAVLSGNRNFEGRIHPQVKYSYLGSPPLVVAYALAGTVHFDFEHDPLGHDDKGKAIYLKDIWPTTAEIQASIHSAVHPEMFQQAYGKVFEGNAFWRELDTPSGKQYTWSDDSTYIQNPPYFDQLTHKPKPIQSIEGARVLAVLGDSITTDHISPAGAIGKSTAAGQYLISLGVAPDDFNSYGARRGNHQVMVRGTFANIRLKNALAQGKEGGFTTHLPSKTLTTIFDASERYRFEGTPLLILAGKEYGSGSSRDWAAKGPKLLGVRVVIAESYERIHRSNLIGMGILPLQFMGNDTAASLGLTGEEHFRFDLHKLAPKGTLSVEATRPDGTVFTFETRLRIDTPVEQAYFENDGILPYVLRNMAKNAV